MSEGRKPGAVDVVEEIIARQMNEVRPLLTLHVIQIGQDRVGTELNTAKFVSARGILQGLNIAATALEQRMELVQQAVVRHQADCGICRLAIRARQGGVQGPLKTHDYMITLREDGHAEVVSDSEVQAAEAAKEVEDGAKEEE